jgi:glycosyltransferase involved in cell wall biosynthesis/2-polyprenyl-3-methyl-5-hydroxy-6-metoxy-1,4-benzoquinol methylase
MIKIMYLYESLHRAGAEQLLVTILKNLDRSRFYPIVYCLGDKGSLAQEIEATGVSVTSLNKKIHILNLAIIYDLMRILKWERPDILHTNLFFPNVFGRVASKLSGLKSVVTTLHNPDYTYENNGRLTFRLRKTIDKYSAELSKTRFIAVSDAVKKDFERNLNFKDIKVIRNFIDTSRFKTKDLNLVAQKRKELGFKEDDIVIANVGRLHPQKGQIHLIEAFDLVHKHNPKCRLLIVGSGALDADLKERVENLRLKESVIFLKDRSDVPEIMCACDIFAFPSLYEGFGIALVEAMACGLAVVASDLEVFRDILTPGSDAILTEKANPQELAKNISKLVDDEKLRKYLGRNAREKALGLFDATRHVRELEDFYQAVSRGDDISCLVCSGGNFKNSIFGGYFYKNKKYNILRCRKCGFMFLDPLPDKETLNNIYSNDDYFDNYYVTSEGKKPYLQAMADFSQADKEIIKIIKGYKQSGSLLDIGCAGGHLLLNAKTAGFQTFGIEPNRKMADYARGALGLDVACAVLEDEVLNQRSFDIIHAGDVLEHILDLKGNIQILKSLLAKDGILVINQPLTYNKSLSNIFLKINMLFKINRYSDNPPTHLWEFNSNTIKAFLQKNGLEIIYFKTSEVKAKPLPSYREATLKNILGKFIKDFSCIISNNFIFNRLTLGDRAVIVCKKS